MKVLLLTLAVLLLLAILDRDETVVRNRVDPKKTHGAADKRRQPPVPKALGSSSSKREEESAREGISPRCALTKRCVSHGKRGNEKSPANRERAGESSLRSSERTVMSAMCTSRSFPIALQDFSLAEDPFYHDPRIWGCGYLLR